MVGRREENRRREAGPKGGPEKKRRGGRRDHEDGRPHLRSAARPPSDQSREEKGGPGGTLRLRRAYGSGLRGVRGGQPCCECAGGHSVWRNFVCRGQRSGLARAGLKR